MNVLCKWLYKVYPIGLAGGLNTYGYVDGNPLSYVDPLGLAGRNGLGFPQQVGRLEVFGCLIGCVSYVEGDPQAKASLAPAVGGGLMICGPPSDDKPSNDECNEGKGPYDPEGDNSFDTSPTGGFKGVGIGFTINDDGSVCVLIGGFVGLAIPLSSSLGGINE